MSHSAATFHKKVFTRLNTSSCPIEALTSMHAQENVLPHKKIVASIATGHLREDFKKTFLPLLVDVFELRQMICSHLEEKLMEEWEGKKLKSPEEILRDLESLQKDVEETLRWCNGVSLQIAKGIEETKALMASPIKKEVVKETFLKKIATFFRDLKK